MTALRHDGLVHSLSDVNKEKRAGRSYCGEYLDFWARDLLEDAVVTCLVCMTEPRAGALAARDVRDRGDDIVMRCQDHLYHRNEDGSCSRCGYLHRVEIVPIVMESK